MEPIVPSIQEFSPLIAFLKVKVTSPCQKFFADITLSDGRGSDWETLVSDEKAPGVLRWFAGWPCGSILIPLARSGNPARS